MELTDEDIRAMGWEPSADGWAEPGPGRYFDGRRFVSAYLGHDVREAGHVRVGPGGSLWRYERGAYRSGAESFVAAFTRRALGPRFQDGYLREALAWLRAEGDSIPGQPDPDIINVANGLLDWRSGDLTPHDPDIPSTVQVPVSYRAGAECPRVERFLGEVLPSDALSTAYEVAGYCLLADQPLRRAVLLRGPGRNGKSTWLRVLRALLGPENVCSVTLQALGESRFAAAELHGKLANLAGDLDARASRSSALFKMLTGNDPITVERKYRDPFSFVSFATLVYSANELPDSYDQSEAYFDRWLVLPFTRRFGEDEADPHLLGKLTTPEELEGLLVRAVAGLRRLMRRGRFDAPPSVEAAGRDYRERVDSVAGFVQEACTVDPEARVRRGALHEAYGRWCERGGRVAIRSPRLFKERLEGYLGDRVRDVTLHGSAWWQGIGLQDDGA